MQSGDKYAHQWQLSWQTSERWTNPLTGWTSSADPHSGMKLTFNTSDDAIAFANRNGEFCWCELHLIYF
jgi:NADH dehydrogenase (ubiquinone) Fe-S protein 4